MYCVCVTAVFIPADFLILSLPLPLPPSNLPTGTSTMVHIGTLQVNAFPSLSTSFDSGKNKMQNFTITQSHYHSMKSVTLSFPLATCTSFTLKPCVLSKWYGGSYFDYPPCSNSLWGGFSQLRMDELQGSGGVTDEVCCMSSRGHCSTMNPTKRNLSYKLYCSFAESCPLEWYDTFIHISLRQHSEITSIQKLGAKINPRSALCYLSVVAIEFRL